MDMNQILKDLPKEMRAMHIKGERAKRELAELEKKEKYAVRKLMEATLQKKKENEEFTKCHVFFLCIFSCQEMHQKNANKTSECKEMDENATAIQSSVDSLDDDLQKLTSE
ncbi:PREDICTED: uncharacterized protein LOC107166237 [Diuraphis noxia]|uniref:uncharacterized protein LOC107166237 n=1 Tax=Diuraphis noxia TaxID=143948 RepID=UPI00076367FE|nr:PREDICTED: uncharacterized protein LOC107166237 [Diuraphis noxia]